MSYKSTNKNIIGPYILWQNYGCEGWKPTSFNSIKEALEGEKYSEFTITKAIDYEVKEKE